ncbi:cutinase [Mycobacterium sp. ACS1612]|uniref:cutinase family protein n=1 Tax=Mycobacterium sp. ACS1612 TaxID=1834117 RepID=UPI0007FF1674|nr:cutinase family protein [Mycobacterium sp. ACS1612]OBF25577.1 cutinase [Mycobacterium sp. ACS1612]
MSNHQRGLRGATHGATAVLTAGLLLIAPSAFSHSLPSASADDCPDVEVTFARGTDEPAGLGRVGQALVDALRQQTGMNIGTYAVNYKASLLQLHTDDGSKDAVAHIKSMADKCPNTPQVLGGYSQGASVVDIVTGNSVGGLLRGTTLPAPYAANVAAVVTFGNVADRTKQPITTHSALLGSKAMDLCNPMDPICHEGPGNEWSGHTEGYVPFYTDQAASFVVAQLLGAQLPTPPDPYAAPGPYATPNPYATPGPYATPNPYATSGPSGTLAPSAAADGPTAFH